MSEERVQPETESETAEISRRRFVAGGLAAGAAAAGLGAESADAAEKHHAHHHKHEHKKKKHRRKRKPKPSTTHKADVVIVGAGMSGMNAARAIKAAGKSVIVLEARNRVGGRCYSRPLGVPGATDVANMGATFIGPTQSQILGLISELGISKFPVYSQGSLLFYENGQLSRYNGTIPPANPLAVVEVGEITLPQIDSMAQTIPLDSPYDAPNAAEWDAMTVQTWIEQNITQSDAQKLFALAVEAILSVEPEDISFLYFLFYVASAGSVEVLIDNAGTGGAQDYRITGGTQNVVVTLANQLGSGNVLLSEPVRRLSQAGNGIVAYADHATVEAQQAIVAIPPNLAGRIVYEPQLTAARDQLTQRMPVGSLIKTIAVYDTPFWRAQGLNGQVTSDQGPVKVMFDASPASGTPGVLLGFIDGADARALDDQSDLVRANAALQSYARYFGAQAANPKVYFDQVWAQEIYTGGCPVGVMPTGVMTEYGAVLREPQGRIHWAGTETATVWNGYMDGAIQAGKRAAAEVLAAL